MERENIDAQKAIFRQAVLVAVSLGLKKVWHIGDIFESRKSQPLTVLAAFIEILDIFEEAGIELEAIPGNHDKVDYDSELSYLDVYRWHPNFTLHRKECTVTYEDVDIHWLPYFLESGSYMERLRSLILNKQKKNVLLTHVAVNGVRNNDGSVVENDLNRTAFKSFDSVLVGHYHDQSSIHNVHYIGSAMQKNFGENTEKGFTILFNDATHEFQKAEFTEYVTVKIDADNLTQEDLDQLLVDYADSTDNIRFKFKGEKSKLVAIDKSKFERVGIDVKFDSTEIQGDLSILNTDEFVQFNKAEVLKEFKDFCKKEKYETSRGLIYLDIIK